MVKVVISSWSVEVIFELFYSSEKSMVSGVGTLKVTVADFPFRFHIVRAPDGGGKGTRKRASKDELVKVLGCTSWFPFVDNFNKATRWCYFFPSAIIALSCAMMSFCLSGD